MNVRSTVYHSYKDGLWQNYDTGPPVREGEVSVVETWNVEAGHLEPLLSNALGSTLTFTNCRILLFESAEGDGIASL